MTDPLAEDEDRADVVSAPTAIDLRSLSEKLVSDSDLTATAIKINHRTGYAPTVTPDSIAPVESEPVLGDDGFGSRYTTSDLLGEGGMGEVRLTRDARIGRQVAMKVVRPGQGSRSDLRSRFLREARVQGQLEHPAIVPVYDLGVRPDGAAFFTMKRVRGKTLEQILEDLRAHDLVAEEEFPRRKLLSAFASICLAIDFAHARGVVHRDLKPGNVMLGGFGEVYLLDWGLAKIQKEEEPLSDEESQAVDAPVSTRGQTEAGAVMGTPGYMAPEQLVSTDVDGRADIYALGAILFEIITLTPLHNKPKLAQILDSTLRGPETRAAVVAPDQDVPPELEAIWTKAVALKRDDRYETARDLSDVLEGFLGGDRDLEQRKKMAAGHVLRGEQAIARSRESGDIDERKAAMQELGRALALDPSNAQAMRAMANILAEPPTKLPAEAEAELERAAERNLRATGRVAYLAYASWFLFLPLILLAGCKEYGLIATIAVCMLGATATSFIVSRQEQPTNYLRFIAIAFSMSAIGFCSRIFGPFMIVPAIALSNAMGYAMTRERRERFFVSSLAVAAWGVPLVLEWAGILAPSYVFENGHITIMPHLLSFDDPFWAQALLISVHGMIMFTGVASVGTVRDDLARHERHSLLQAWHFRQLAPDEARAAAPTAPTNADHYCPVDDLKAVTQPTSAQTR